MTKRIKSITVRLTFTHTDDFPAKKYVIELQWYQNKAFVSPCLSETMTLIAEDDSYEFNYKEMEMAKFWADSIRLSFALLKETSNIFDGLNEVVEEFLKKLIPTARLITEFNDSKDTAKEYPVKFDENRLWLSETSPIADTDYLFNLLDQWVDLSEKPETDQIEMIEQFNSFVSDLGKKLVSRKPQMNAVNFFVSPLNDLFNVDELIRTETERGGNIWSANRYCSYGDVMLFYFTKQGGKILKSVEFYGSDQQFFSRLPGSIFAAARLYTDSLRQERKGPFYWNSRVFVGDVIVFDVPIPADDIKNSHGESLTSHFRNSRGGIRQPKSLYGHDDFLDAFKDQLFKYNPALKNTYLNLAPYWPASVPLPDSENWAEEMGKADARLFKDKDKNRNLNEKHVVNFFQDEEGVRKMFIDPLLKLVIPKDARNLPEYKTHADKTIRVDYCIEKNDLKLPIEAKFDIKTDQSIDWQRIYDYLDISHRRQGLLIDINGVFILSKEKQSRDLLFAREGMNKESVQKLKKWINDYFRRS